MFVFLYLIFHLEWAHEGLINGHHASGIVKLATVIGGREQSHLIKNQLSNRHRRFFNKMPLFNPHQLPLGEKLVTIFYHLRVRITQKLPIEGCVNLQYNVYETWCALHIRSRSCLLRNFETTSAPNVKLTPRSFSPQPCWLDSTINCYL